MEPNQQSEVNNIAKKIILSQLFFSVPGTILLGLAAYGWFGANGEAFWAPLNDRSNLINMAIAGAMLESWSVFKLISLSKRQKDLSK